MYFMWISSLSRLFDSIIHPISSKRKNNRRSFFDIL
nr:MAG TPA: hypothetical protein [Caudoviricetes sp.]